MAFAGCSSHSCDDANSAIELQQSPAIRSPVTKEPTNRPRAPEDRVSSELKRLLMTPRLDVSSSSMGNRAREQSVPVDLRKRDSIKLTQTENIMDYAYRPAIQCASNKPFSVHGDYLSKPSQISQVLEDLFADIAEDLDLESSIADHVSEEELFEMTNTQNVDEYHELNVDIRDEVLPIEENKNDTTKARKRKMAKFTLPPDYDPNDSRWTLRYRNPRPELTELLPNSGVYVNTSILKSCNEFATDCKSLARMLTMHVFSDSALKVCSFTGAKATFYGGLRTEVRPGLDKDARYVLVEYVKTYGQKRGWYIDDCRGIVNTIRNKLYSSRCRERHRV